MELQLVYVGGAFPGFPCKAEPGVWSVTSCTNTGTHKGGRGDSHFTFWILFIK